ncbi:MAG: sensor domain-containing protein [Candidatus Aminicenantaceae bacterium]
MTNSIDAYLDRLRSELKGSDPALIQDALSDTEEHLRSALDTVLGETPGLTEAEALPALFEKYGNPAEVAAAYRDAEALLTPFHTAALPPPSRSFISRFFRILAEPKAWGAFLYTLLAFLFGMIYCAWAVVGGAVAIPSLLFIVGVPLTALFLLSLRGFGLLEGRIAEALLGVRMPRKPFFVNRDEKLTTKFKSLYTEALTWKILLYMLLQFPLGLLYLGIVWGTFLFAFAFVTAPVFELIFHIPLDLVGTDRFTPLWLLPFVFLAGLFLVPATLHLARWVGKLHGRYAKAMLVRK